MALPFKVRTKDLPLEPYGMEGVLKIRGINTRVSKTIAEINKKYNNKDGEDQIANIESGVAICMGCIVEAPFDITEENIEEFPPALIAEVMRVAMEMEDNKIPLA